MLLIQLIFYRIKVDDVVGKSEGSVRTVRDTSSENAVKTLQWLLKSVSNLKSDVSQINQNFNVSKTLQHSDEIQKQINLIQVLKLLLHYLTNA